MREDVMQDHLKCTYCPDGAGKRISDRVVSCTECGATWAINQ